MVPNPSVGDLERAERAIKRSLMRRAAVVEDFSRLYDLATRVKSDRSVVSLFRAQKSDVEQFMAEFTIEQDSIMDMLLLVGREEEYTEKHAPISREIKQQYYFIHATSQELVIEQPTGQQVRANIHLPKITLPSFNGDILQWPTFRDKFIALVDSDVSLAPIEKFHYLSGCLVERAATLIGSLKMTDANYPIVWKKLNDQFNNPRLSATTLIDGVLNFRRMEFETISGLTAFLHVFDESLRSLESFSIEDLASFVLFVLASKNLPRCTREIFESENSAVFPSIEDLVTFIRYRIKVLENIGAPVVNKWMPKDKSNNKSVGKPNNKIVMVASSGDSSFKCPLCKGRHDLKVCSKFLKMPASKRYTVVSSVRRCFRCLSSTHMAPACHTEERCSTCDGSHHSLLHFRKSSANVVVKNSTIGNNLGGAEDISKPSELSDVIPSGAVSNIGKMGSSTVVLGTALAHTRDRFGQIVEVRMLVDSGSQISAITQSCATRLGLSIKKWTVPVSGLAGVSVPKVQGLTSCIITPTFEDEPKIEVNAWVLPNITVNLPSSPIEASVKDKFSHIGLADPTFHIPSPIDILLGADLFHHVFDGKQFSESDGVPTAYSSIFGWILIGPVHPAPSSFNQTFVVSLVTSLDDMLIKFWEVDEPDTAPIDITEDGRCEKIFLEKSSRNHSGRFIVPLPFKDGNSKWLLKGSKNIAEKRFFNLERRLMSNPSLYDAYRDFMEEYISLGHMQVASTPGDYFIPHHAVTKTVNNTLKIRVVFDASSKAPSGKSLNDLLLTGPKLQNDITDILLRFRIPKFVFLADICKMYRQILICSDHCSFQHILWRPQPDAELEEYELKTVTYGTGPAPYLAIKVLHQVAESCRVKFPRVYEAIIHNTYVDDICAGEDSLEDAVDLQRNLISVLETYGLELKKWTSNCTELLERIDPSARSKFVVSFDKSEDGFVKVLGLHWDPVKDTIGYHVSPEVGPHTKRGVLSVIARLYDPVGLLAPVTFWAKEFLQRVWKTGLHWDTDLPQELSDEWRAYLLELPAVSNSNVPRHINIVSGDEFHLCGFCDASIKGYAAVIYLRICRRDSITLHLVGAKSKVAPIKTLTVPRLELSGALLLAKWMDRIKVALQPRIHVDRMYAWTDSTIVLSWLVNVQVDYKIFVTNRVAKIRNLTPTCVWNHVVSTENPADCVSRGLLPSQLWSHKLYWHGPIFLKNMTMDIVSECFHPLSPDELPEVRLQSSVVAMSNTVNNEIDVVSRYSSLSFAQRVFAWVWRFIDRTQKRPIHQRAITQLELQRARDSLVYLTQQQYFGIWMKKLKSDPYDGIPKSLSTLKPYVDENNIIRVGGRLRYSSLSNQAKFPILVPKESHLAMLILQHYHLCYLHAGPRLLSSMVSRIFWITSMRNEIRKVIKLCVSCSKWAAVNPRPAMADLPASRVNPSRPFSHVGIDYGGPFVVRESRRRKSKEHKAYMALFICFSTKAVHIETTTDLSTEAFLASFDRFIARRGIPTDVYTDCGTNFVGANRQLKEMLARDDVQSHLVSNTVCHWHFNPPAAPHFGGLWEAGIKSAKFHLKRAIGTQVLTFEELTTVLTRIEAILNSRPLTALSSDPSEVDCLTPGHLLIGQPLVALPDRIVTDIAQNRLTRWQLVQQCHQHFWNRWSREYLTTLQTRCKWTNSHPNIDVGDIVIIKTSHVPPTIWPTGRVIAVHPGEDNVVRVVTLKTATGEFKRPVVKLVKLPTDG